MNETAAFQRTLHLIDAGVMPTHPSKGTMKLTKKRARFLLDNGYNRDISRAHLSNLEAEFSRGAMAGGTKLNITNLVDCDTGKIVGKLTEAQHRCKLVADERIEEFEIEVETGLPEDSLAIQGTGLKQPLATVLAKVQKAPATDGHVQTDNAWIKTSNAIGRVVLGVAQPFRGVLALEDWANLTKTLFDAPSKITNAPYVPQAKGRSKRSEFTTAEAKAAFWLYCAANPKKVVETTQFWNDLLYSAPVLRSPVERARAEIRKREVIGATSYVERQTRKVTNIYACIRYFVEGYPVVDRFVPTEKDIAQALTACGLQIVDGKIVSL